MNETPIVTGEYVAGSIEMWMGLMALLGLVVFVGFAAIAAALADDNARPYQTFLVGLVAGAGGVCFFIGIWQMLDHWGVDTREVDNTALASAISDDYTIAEIRFVPTEGDDRTITTPDVDELCGAVSTNSPEYTGVVNGQQIRFRVGVKYCSTTDPEIEIIITDTPGQSISPEGLRKD